MRAKRTISGMQHEQRRLAAKLRHAALTRQDSALPSAREQVLLAREQLVQARELAANVSERGGGWRRRMRGVAASHITMLRQANSHLVVASMAAVMLAEQVQQAKLELDHLANHDVLTKLPNRALLGDRLAQAIELARRRDGQLAVMFIDLDRFKHINDSLGHAVGDLLLQEVARCLAHCVRSSDTVSRQGGDEFILLLPEIEHAEDAAAIAQKILQAMLLPHRIERHALHIGLSMGISLYPADGQDADTLLRNADLAMYHAKQTGRNNCTFYEPAMNARAKLRLSTEAGLRLALVRKEFVLHYQPKIALASGKLVGVEALVRWQHPQLGLLLPNHFVAVAEECGMIVPLGRWVLRQACEQAQAWRRQGLPPLLMAVNTSPLEFRSAGFLAYLRQTLAETGLWPACLELELTENMLMHDGTSSDNLLQEIARLGVKLAIDDFGTGYSSLSYLTRFPIHTLKIDQSFVSQMSSSADDATIVSAVINMGKSLHKQVIAEGVETQQQHDFLTAQGCDEGQGHFFSRALDAAAFTRLFGPAAGA
ncbi:putative bifunctional diguanylate cyclase/phosphodiesterase [Rugamonas apoptosis]|uniref:EAL domain-containing protein n=1 Tax=Rugamonas apoptosis TaxID=2758570 RepID=A0A7W2FDK3_9BURK|nr:EAL domain-containing protein [Rugamonas apoptosis]MBA5689756.1 EAL domain-containing protein [Rugamonas apoptosis]